MNDENINNNSDQIVLFADFDSANMAKYEKVLISSSNKINNNNNNNENGATNFNGDNNNHDINEHNKQIENQKFDAEFNIWTKNDCQGTPYSNGNRTWFYFGVRGGYGKWVKFNIMNLNRQGRLFEMGMLPVFKTVPGHEKWSRIYSRPTWQNLENNFQMSFCFHLPDRKSTVTYFAFCFPFSYEDCQNQLSKLDKEFEYCKDINPNKCDPELIYYHRELFCNSLDNRRVDLLTISACNDTNFKREPRFDKNLFPDKNNPRPYNFNKKRVFVLTSRVHPGETPASFVFNGFLEFILNKDDPRAKALRKHFVFKLIPLLNPDGVSRGHYRTDQLGMNLNRVYLDPSLTVHPTIYAAKSLLVYHHIMNRVNKDQDGLNFNGIFDLKYDLNNSDYKKEIYETNNIDNIDNELENDNQLLIENSIVNDLNEANKIHSPITTTSLLLSGSSKQLHLNSDFENHNKKFENLNIDEAHRKTPMATYSDLPSSRSNKVLLSPIKRTPLQIHGNDDNDDILKLLSNNSSNLYSLKKSHDSNINELKRKFKSEPYIGNEGSDDDADDNNNNNEYLNPKVPNSPHLNDPRLLLINPNFSGIAFYVDLHGHAAKRGCFIYGNAIENEAYQVENVLFAKLISVNSQHFDFEGCNFSVKNMYFKDKREGLSKEGSGRVALYKTTGLIHSYTLECNYACGRVMNTMAPAANSSLYNGRISPPQHTELPPKFLPEHYQNVGKGLAIAALDITDLNPCSRITNTTFGSLEAIRNWVKFYIRTKPGNKKTNLTRSQQLSKNFKDNNSSTQSMSQNLSENKQVSRRNTAPSAFQKQNNNLDNSTKKFLTQLSTPNNLTSSNTLLALKENKSLFQNRTKIFNQLNKPTSQQNTIRKQIIKTPVNESKNFIKKVETSDTKKTRSINEMFNENDDDIDFREFNKFINKNYENKDNGDNNDDDDDDDDVVVVLNDNKSNKEDSIINEEIEIINENENLTCKQAPQITKETNWFFNENDNEIIKIDNELIQNDNNKNNNLSNNQSINLNKSNSRLQRLNNISRNLTNSSRELFPINKANVLHNNNENGNGNGNKQFININYTSSTISSNLTDSTGQFTALSKQYLPKSISNQKLKKNQKSQTIKAIYNAGVIKKFLNTNKLQLPTHAEIKTITNAFVIQQQQLPNQSLPQQHQQLYRSPTMLQQEQVQEKSNNDNLKVRKKYPTIENKNKFTNKKTLQLSQIRNQVLNDDQPIDSKKIKQKYTNKKVDLGFHDIERVDSLVKTNGHNDDTAAFWVDL